MRRNTTVLRDPHRHSWQTTKSQSMKGEARSGGRARRELRGDGDARSQFLGARRRCAHGSCSLRLSDQRLAFRSAFDQAPPKRQTVCARGRE